MTFVIQEHICGWRGIAFGGYVAGLMVSKEPGQPMKVSFKAPVPVGIPLHLVPEGDRVSIVQDAAILATAEPAQGIPNPPMVPSHVEVQAAAAQFPAREAHPQPRCFGCGPDLPVGVGLRVFAGPSPGRGFVGAAWTPDPSFGDSRSNLATEYVWAALDCPAGWARNHFLPSGTCQ